MTTVPSGVSMAMVSSVASTLPSSSTNAFRSSTTTVPSSPTAVLTTSTSSMPSSSELLSASGTVAPRSRDGEPVVFHTVPVPLPGFTESTFTHDGMTRPVYAAGTGPAVIVIHEVPGLHPQVAAFAQRVVDAGFSVRMPSLFGTPGREVGVAYTVETMAKVCVAKEFSAFALDRTSPVIGWLRRLAAEAHRECGGPGVGAVGMCFTGGFALGMMVDDTMLAPVLSQPSLPFPVSASRRRSVGISDADLERVKARASEGACLLGLRFTDDKAVPPAR